MEENETRKGVCNKPLKYDCRGLEESRKDVIPPSIFSPSLGGPSNQDRKNHHKLKRYGIISLVFFHCKKRGHKARNFVSLEGQESHVVTIVVLQIE